MNKCTLRMHSICPGWDAVGKYSEPGRIHAKSWASLRGMRCPGLGCMSQPEDMVHWCRCSVGSVGIHRPRAGGIPWGHFPSLLTLAQGCEDLWSEPRVATHIKPLWQFPPASGPLADWKGDLDRQRWPVTDRPPYPGPTKTSLSSLAALTAIIPLW